MGGEVEEDVVDEGVDGLELLKLLAAADEVVEGLSGVGLLPEEVRGALWLEVGVEFLGRAFFRKVLARNFNLNYLLKQPNLLDLE